MQFFFASRSKFGSKRSCFSWPLERHGASGGSRSVSCTAGWCARRGVLSTDRGRQHATASLPFSREPLRMYPNWFGKKRAATGFMELHVLLCAVVRGGLSCKLGTANLNDVQHLVKVSNKIGSEPKHGTSLGSAAAKTTSCFQPNFGYAKGLANLCFNYYTVTIGCIICSKKTSQQILEVSCKLPDGRSPACS